MVRVRHGAGTQAVRSRRVVMLTAAVLLVAACAAPEESGTTSPDADAASSTVESPTSEPEAAPEPEPAPDPEPVPEPEPEPGPELLLATVPRTSWDASQHVRNAEFQRIDSDRHREAGQTVRVTDPFTLERIGIVVDGPSIALPGYRDYPDGTDFSILEPFVENPGVVEDLGIRLSIVLYRSPSAEGFPTVRRVTSGFGPVPRMERDVIRIPDLEVITDQPLVGRIDAGVGVSLLDLAEPVLVEPGYWMIALRVDRGLDDVDLLDLKLVGVESGDTVDDRDDGTEPCDYTRTSDPYPDGAFFWREEASSDFFIPAFAKVTECIVMGRYDNIMNEGDIILDLYGAPVG